MRVVLANRSTSQKVLAGDSVQQHKTAEALRQIGIVVQTVEGDISSVKNAELIHLFNVIPVEESFRMFRQAKELGLPVVFSPIYWDPHEFLARAYESGTREFEDWWEKTEEQRRIMLRQSDMILPNGQAELELLHKTYGPLAPARIVPNAADSLFYSSRPGRFRKRFGSNRFILCVGRISRRKNQLGLIRALQRQTFHLVFIGPVNDFAYYRECRAEPTRCSVHFIDSLTPVELASAYSAADLHVLPSWYETPGLATLEAALAGCKIVTTERGTAFEYLGKAAWYCDPGDLNSIRGAVLEALAHPGYPDLRHRILRDFTWEKAAQLTLGAYRTVLDA